MKRNIFRSFSGLLLAVILILLGAMPALAFDGRTGESVTIDKGEVVDDDLYIAGGDLVINGTVEGDVFAGGRNVTVNGDIEGAATIAGQYITINGSVRDSVRLAGQNITIIGDIGGDAVIFGQTVLIQNGSTIGGDLVLGASMVNVNGAVEGWVMGGGGQVMISDEVGEDVNLEVNKLIITSTAVIKGNVDYTSEQEAEIHSNAEIDGTVNRTLPAVKEPDKKGPAAEIPGKIAGFLMAFITGLVIIFLATRKITGMSEALIKYPWYCLGWGAFLLFVTPFAVIILLAIVIGIPLSLILTAAYAIAIYLSIIPVSLCIGRLIIGRQKTENRRGLLLAALAVGLAILTIIKFIPVFGFIVGVFTALFGMGTIIVYFTKIYER
jgi:cytoskeletal protein CcmA (bactofilin family)